jgi:acetyltransferase-like isoleucine patch superfamily enzyme
MQLPDSVRSGVNEKGGVNVPSLRYQLFRLRFACILSAGKRTKIIRKGKVFNPIGEKVTWQPRKLPADPRRIRLHNNVQIASGVTFINHDLTADVLNRMGLDFRFSHTKGCIEILDNVSVGAGTIILPNIRIGPNVVIGAGSIITKDVPPNTVVAGVPAKVIGTFDEYVEKRKKYTIEKKHIKTHEDLWEDFYAQRMEK